MGPHVPADGGSKRLIRPLCYASKDLIETCARPLEFPATGNCAYSRQLDDHGDRAYLEHMLPELGKHFPNLEKNMLHSMADVRLDYLLDQKLWSKQ
jgi:tRNA(Ile)-lysidine synthase TilS/MesJ